MGAIVIAGKRSHVIHLAEARRRIPGSGGEHATNVLQRDTLDIALSIPGSPRQQTPHAQDELYFIVSGRGVLYHDGNRDAFQAGDLVFVAAGVDHQFAEHSEDLVVWRVFYGPPALED